MLLVFAIFEVFVTVIAIVQDPSWHLAKGSSRIHLFEIIHSSTNGTALVAYAETALNAEMGQTRKIPIREQTPVQAGSI